MKKKLLAKVMTMIMASALVFGNMGVMTVHATDDGLDHGDGREPGGGGGGDFDFGGGSSDSGSSSGGGSSESYSAPSDNGGSSSSHSGGGSSDSGSNGGGSSYDGGSTGAGGGDNGSSGSTASTPAPTGLAVKGNTAAIPGKETFRQINNPADGRASIYHCGIEQYTAQLKDADGNAVGYTSCNLYLDDLTGKWYLDIITNTADCTVGTYKGSVAYLPKLGISGVMVNDVVIVNAEEAAAAAAE